MGRSSFTAFLLSAILAAGPPLLGQARLEWVRRYDSPSRGSEWARAMVLDGDGNVFMAGSTGQFGGGNEDALTVKIGPDGRRLWSARFNGPRHEQDHAEAMALGADGSAYVAGYSSVPGNDTDFAVVKYDGAGHPVWTALYNGPGNGADRANLLALDPDGQVIVAGQDFSPQSSNDFAVIKYALPAPSFPFRRGDANGSGKVNIADAIASIRSLFLGAEPLPCQDAADADDDGALGVTDIVFTLTYLFLGGVETPAPGAAACGPDPTPDGLDCAAYPCP
ncbi:MAG: hypothetical protein HY717_05160 [Planctomycetes bacterium]|nr:hypothetical protein [Planctomycetota bacterium]